MVDQLTESEIRARLRDARAKHAGGLYEELQAPLCDALEGALRLLDAEREEARREDRRWTARVKLLETRIDFAVDALRGKVELDRE